MLQHLKKMSEPSASLLLVLLLSADFVLIVLHVMIGIFDPNPALCDISGICAYMDIYHLIKMFWIIILLLYVLKKARYPGYAAWILMFICFFIDDSLWLHQKIGDRVASLLNVSGLPSRFFELAVLAIAGLALMTIVAWFYFKGPATFKKISIDISVFLAALVFFGLRVDIAEVVRLGHRVILGLQFVEDGGELVVYSLILWYVFLLVLRKGKTDMFLLDLVRKP